MASLYWKAPWRRSAHNGEPVELFHWISTKGCRWLCARLQYSIALAMELPQSCPKQLIINVTPLSKCWELNHLCIDPLNSNSSSFDMAVMWPVYAASCEQFSFSFGFYSTKPEKFHKNKPMKCWNQNFGNTYFHTFRADSRFAPSQWDTLLQSNAISH